MLRKCLSLVLAGLLVSLVNGAQPSALTGAKESHPTVEKIKAKIARRGTGAKALVRIKTQDGMKMKGHISEAGEDTFVLVDSKTGKATTVSYSDIIKVENAGGVTKATWLGVGAAVGVVALIIAVKASDPLEGFRGIGP
jgi:hypothetical protein